MGRLVDVSASSNGLLYIHFNRKFLPAKQTLGYAQIVSSTKGLQVGQKYGSSTSKAATEESQTPAHLDHSHPAACQAAHDVIVERNMALQKTITPGVDPLPDVNAVIDMAAAAAAPFATPLITLPTTNAGSISSGYSAVYPNRYYIVGYDNNKVITFISDHPCRDPSDDYFELVSKGGKFVLGWDNEHCFASGYIALYNYEPALGANPADLKGYKTYQWTTKGSSYNTGVTDDGKQWYAAMCTWDGAANTWTILRVVGVVESVEVYDLNYEDVTNDLITTTDQQVFTVDASNSSNAPITTNCTQSFTMEQTYTWVTTWGAKIAVEYSITTGIPILLPTGTKVSVEGSHTWESGTANTTSQTVSVVQSLVVEPQTKNVVKFESLIGGVSNLKFHAKTRALCRGGETFDSPTRDVVGEYTGAVSNRIMVDVGPAVALTTATTTTDRPAAVAMEETPPPQQIAAELITAVEKDGSGQQVFAVEADTIYWYYVDQNGQLHPTSTGI